MSEIVIEIDEELLEQLKEILSPMGLTPEFVAEQFIRFCADPDNTAAPAAQPQPIATAPTGPICRLRSRCCA